jgi:tetratricopeptide (TPR) repeat protein
MSHRTPLVLVHVLALILFLSAEDVSAKEIVCQDGVRYEIDLKQVAIQYQGSSFSGSLNALGAFAGRLSLETKALQHTSSAAQQWNEFLKGLVAGYNKCAISKHQYAEGLSRIYPKLQEDGTQLVQIQRALEKGKSIDEKQLERILKRVLENLTRFARISGQEVVIARIGAIIESSTEKVLDSNEEILRRLYAIENRISQSPIRPPTDFKAEIERSLQMKTNQALSEYTKGYNLFQSYKFTEAIPFLERALGIVQLPEFYLALGEAYLEAGNLKKAQHTLLAGLGKVDEGGSAPEASLTTQLGLVLLGQGDMEAALGKFKRSQEIYEQIGGSKNPSLPGPLINIGSVLLAKGNREQALSHAERALAILEQAAGKNDPQVAPALLLIAQIMASRGNINEARQRLGRAREIYESAYGANDPRVAGVLSYLGIIEVAEGNLDISSQHWKKSNAILEGVLSPGHPLMGVSVNNLGLMLATKGDLNGALNNFKQALSVFSNVYGPRSQAVALALQNIGYILSLRGEKDEALQYLNRALTMHKAITGQESPNVAYVLIAIGEVFATMRNKGKDESDVNNAQMLGKNLSYPIVEAHQDNRYQDKALNHFNSALGILERQFGKNDPSIVIALSSIARILLERGDSHSALLKLRAALEVSDHAYGVNNVRGAHLVTFIAFVLLDEGKREEAFSYMNRLPQIYESARDNPNAERAILKVGSRLVKDGEYGAAENYVTQGLKIAERFHGSNSPKLASLLTTLGIISLDKGDSDGALQHFQRILHIWKDSSTRKHRAVAFAGRNIGIILYLKGQRSSGLSYLEEARKLYEQLGGPNDPSALAIGEVMHYLTRSDKEPLVLDVPAMAGVDSILLGQGVRVTIDNFTDGRDEKERLGIYDRRLGSLSYGRSDFVLSDSSVSVKLGGLTLKCLEDVSHHKAEDHIGTLKDHGDVFLSGNVLRLSVDAIDKNDFTTDISSNFKMAVKLNNSSDGSTVHMTINAAGMMTLNAAERDIDVGESTDIRMEELAVNDIKTNAALLLADVIESGCEKLSSDLKIEDGKFSLK